MKKLIIVAIVLYGLIAAVTGMARAIDLWDNPISANLVQEAVSAGVFWPATLLDKLY